MFMGYCISDWLRVVEYVFIVLVLFTGAFVLSCICTNKTTHKEKIKNNNNNKQNIKGKKSYFIDVA